MRRQIQQLKFELSSVLNKEYDVWYDYWLWESS
jgi:hypothetical protein